VNLAKQLNVLLGNLGVPDTQILIDPTTGGLGYGLEYTYSVMERIRMAALTQQDERLQFPLICNMAKEVWKSKEVKVPEADAPHLGDAKKRGILMEAVTAMVLLLAGANILVMRHPAAIGLVKGMIGELLKP
jgi:acetyl-CoA decarbonylase/synthase complex subunit delta